MRKRILAMIFAGLLVCAPAANVSAAEISDVDTAAENTEATAPEEADAEAAGMPAEDEEATATETEDEAAAPEGEDAAEAEDETAAPEEADEQEQEAPAEDAEGTASEGENVDDAQTESFDIHVDNYVDVQAIDLSLHGQTSGDFTPVYMFDNPFLGKDTSEGVIFEFYVEPTWDINVLGTIFAIVGTDEYDGRLYFTPGSYFGYNSGLFGGYFDANLYNYQIVTDYIKDGALIRIEVMPAGFAVYADDVLCYDQTILDDSLLGSGDYTGASDFSPVLEWLAGAQTLYFGYGSWWNTAGSNEANANLAEVSFCLADGTVVFDQLQADRELVERLGGSVDLTVDSTAESDITVNIADVEVELFDINSVQYEAASILPAMIVAVAVVAVLAVVIVIVATKKRTYDDI